MKISKMITDKYKLRIPPTVYYELLADVREAEEEQEPTTKNDLWVASGLEKNSKKLEKGTAKNDLGVDCISRKFMRDLGATCIAYRNDKQKLIPIISIDDLPSVTPQEPKIVTIAEIKYDKDKLKELVNKAVLTVTPQEPKTGHWIVNAPQYDMLNPQYICSECGNAHTRTTPYCEMCGAKMVEPQESEGT